MARRFLPPIVYREQFSQIVFTIKTVTSLLWKLNRGFTLAIFVLSAFWGLLTFPAFYLEKLILDRIVANIGIASVSEVLTPIAFLVVGRVFIETLRNALTNILGFLRRHASRTFQMKLDVILGRKLGELDALTIEDPNFQDRYNRVERESGMRAWGLMMPLTDIPNYTFGLVASLGILWFLHPLVAVGGLLVLLPLVWVDRGFIKKEYDLVWELTPLHRMYGWLSHYLTRTRSYLELRILGIKDYLSDKMDSIQDDILSRELNLAREKERAHILTYFPTLLFYIGVNIYLVTLALAQKITVGSYEMFLRSLLAAAQNFTGLANSFLEIYENYMFVQDLTWFLALEPQVKTRRRGKRLGRVIRQVELKNVWFRYKEDSEWILRNVNTSFRVGEKIAIVGENGAGKSTLMKLLARFYDPQKGKILVDDTELRNVNLSDYQSKFAILFQNFETYPFSVKETIGYGEVKRLSRLSEIKSAAAKTGIDEYVESLPLRYRNPLDPQFPKGVQPSGGQWQRFGISRVLFRKGAEILVLDEPTSNVDPEAEEKIFNELLKISKNKILIFVSQRFSTVRKADKILVVDKGKIIEQGTHEELMGIDGKYAKLFKLQAQGYR